jgi:hypothetical protein
MRSNVATRGSEPHVRPPRVVQSAGVRRVGRYILKGLTVLSLVLYVATVGLWVSEPLVACCLHRSGQSAFFVATGHGGIAVARQRWTLLANDRLKAAELTPDTVPSGEQPDISEYEKFCWASGPRGRSTICPVNQMDHRQLSLRRTKSPVVGINSRQFGRDDWRLTLPYPWLVATLTCVLTPVVLIERRRLMRCTNRNRFGLCLCCGYDLCATPDRCPECGTVPTEAKR